MSTNPQANPNDKAQAKPETDEDLVKRDFLAHPLTGEALDLANMTTTDLAENYGNLTGPGGLFEALGRYKASLIAELARRLDSVNARSERVGAYKIETNAPTEDVYKLDVLQAELEQLVKAGVLAPEVLARVIVRPPPAMPIPRVDKREVNKLKTSDNDAVLAAVAKARERRQVTRTIKITEVTA